MAERQEGIPVALAEREHAKALHVRAADMVVGAGQQLYFLGAVAAEQRVVDDEDIPARSARQRRDGLLDDGCAQEQRELAPMNGAGVQEAVERIPLKRDGLWRILLPLVEGTPLEHRLERDEEDGHDRKAAQLVGIATRRGHRARQGLPGRRDADGLQVHRRQDHGLPHGSRA